MADLVEIPGGYGAAVPLRAGQILHLVNTHGGQVVDAWALNAADLAEHMSVEHTRRMTGQLFPAVGDDLLSNRRNPMLRLEEDSWGGDHDTLCAACDPWLYRHYGVEGHHRSCHENFNEALFAQGLVPPSLPNPLNLWMNVSISDNRSMQLNRPTSAAGDHIRLRALMDVVVVMSACPMDISPVNAGDGTPQPVHYRVEEQGA